ncbi:UNVERIFIED_CONTAM: hypothetical protein HDU68_004480 [Siphonaria sp. JEL0065]|nr:hypothetical protein HDU68_004480 [Siphonaria sp. JEL0065]
MTEEVVAIPSILVSTFSGTLFKLSLLLNDAETNQETLKRILNSTKHEVEQLEAQKARRNAAAQNDDMLKRKSLPKEPAVSAIQTFQTKITHQSTRFDLLRSLTPELTRIFHVLEGAKRDRDYLLWQGMREVEVCVGSGSLADYFDEDLIKVLELSGQGKAVMEEGKDSVEKAVWELCELYVVSYALRGADVGGRREWFETKVWETVKNGASFEMIRKLFYDERILQ